MERPQKIICTALQETNSEQNGKLTHEDVNNFRAAIYRERRKKYGHTIPRSTHEKSACLRELFTQYSTGHHRLDYLQRVGYQFAPSS